MCDFESVGKSQKEAELNLDGVRINHGVSLVKRAESQIRAVTRKK